MLTRRALEETSVATNTLNYGTYYCVSGDGFKDGAVKQVHMSGRVVMTGTCDHQHFQLQRSWALDDDMKPTTQTDDTADMREWGVLDRLHLCEWASDERVVPVQ